MNRAAARSDRPPIEISRGSARFLAMWRRFGHDE
jgi:hypothetical protein